MLLQTNGDRSFSCLYAFITRHLCSVVLGTSFRTTSTLSGLETSSTTRSGLSPSVPASTISMSSQVSTTQFSSFPIVVLNGRLSSTEIASTSVSSASTLGILSTILTVYTTIYYTVTSFHSTERELSARIWLVTTDKISLYTTICPENVPISSVLSTEVPPERISTIYTTTTYTIISCHPTITNCPIGHVTTDTISVYTTVSPTETHPSPTQSAYVIGVLVTTIIVDITVQVIVNEISGPTGSANPQLFSGPS